MAMSAVHRLKFAALLEWRLHMSEKFSSGTIYPKQTNKQTIASQNNFVTAYHIKRITESNILYRFEPHLNLYLYGSY